MAPIQTSGEPVLAVLEDSSVISDDPDEFASSELDPTPVADPPDEEDSGPSPPPPDSVPVATGGSPRRG